MADDHGHRRFEELALGHVLGGLPSRDASLFRAHLVECRECRRRVVELRDIADDLAATEREERRRASVATQVADRTEADADADGGRPWWLVAGAVVVVLAVAGVLFWNYHLRRVTATYAGVVTEQADVLDALAAGTEIPVETRGEVRGRAAVDGDVLAVTLTDLPPVAAGHVVVLWRVVDGEHRLDPAPHSPANGSLPFQIDIDGADEIVVSVERRGGIEPDQPASQLLAHIDLSQGD